MREARRSFGLVILAAAIFTAQGNAVTGAGRAPQRPPQPMPPDLVAPAEPHPQPAPQASPAPQRPAAPVPGVVPGPGPQPAHAAGKRRSAGKPIPEPAPPAPEPAPVAPPTPQQMPPTPPRVTYGDGLLTITANNSTLSDVLNAVRARTGATVQLPATASSERVFAQIGPAPPRDALAALLNGSHYDYVIVGAPDDPNALLQVLLTQRSAEGSGTAMAAAPVRSAPPASRLPGMGEAPQTNDEADADANDERNPPQPGAPQNPAMTTPAAAQPGPPPAGAPPAVVTPIPPQAGAPPAASAPPTPKTPDQYLDELNRMKQQEQAKPKPPPQ